MDRVFITGANGLLGTNLTLMLLELNYEVFAFVRNKNSLVQHNLKNLTIVEGDLNNKELLSNSIKGSQFVVHIAANTSQNLLSLDEYYNTNVLGTKNIIDACIKNDIKKLIYIGTANTYGYGDILNPGHEELPMKKPFTKSLYALSKNQAQQLIDQSSKRLNITTISPTFMIGAYDTKPSSGRIILMALHKRFLIYPSGGKNFVHVSDVARIIIQAFGIKESGKKFIAANQNLSFKDFYKKVVALNNQKTTLIPLPNWIIMTAGIIGDLIRFLGIKTELSYTNTRALTINNFYSNRKVVKELNIDFSPIDSAIIEAINYFSNNNSTKK